MNPRKLSLILMLGGSAVILLALVWFISVFAEAMDTTSRFAGTDHAFSLMACLYSSGPFCQGVALFSDGPAYTPVVFWIGVIALLAGIVIRFAAGQHVGASGAAAPASTEPTPADTEIMGFIPPAQYARYSYILALCGAAGGLLFTPLSIVTVAGFLLGVFGLTVFRARLNALDVQHLGVLCVVFLATALMLFVTRGTFLFLLTALAQIALFYVGFNSYRHGRTISTQNLKSEFLMALKPGTPPLADHDKKPISPPTE